MSDLNTWLDRLNEALGLFALWLTLAYSCIGIFIMVRRWWLSREATTKEKV